MKPVVFSRSSTQIATQALIVRRSEVAALSKASDTFFGILK
jgi:hypothetical protein